MSGRRSCQKPTPTSSKTNLQPNVSVNKSQVTTVKRTGCGAAKVTEKTRTSMGYTPRVAASGSRTSISGLGSSYAVVRTEAVSNTGSGTQYTKVQISGVNVDPNKISFKKPTCSTLKSSTSKTRASTCGTRSKTSCGNTSQKSCGLGAPIPAPEISDRPPVPPGRYFHPSAPVKDCSSPQNLKAKLSKYTPTSLSHWKSKLESPFLRPIADLKKYHKDIESSNMVVSVSRKGANEEQIAEIQHQMLHDIFDQRLDPSLPEDQWSLSLREALAVQEGEFEQEDGLYGIRDTVKEKSFDAEVASPQPGPSRSQSKSPRTMHVEQVEHEVKVTPKSHRSRSPKSSGSSRKRIRSSPSKSSCNSRGGSPCKSPALAPIQSIREPSSDKTTDERIVQPPKMQSPVGPIQTQRELKMSRQANISPKGIVVDRNLTGTKTTSPGRAQQMEINQREMIPPRSPRSPSRLPVLRPPSPQQYLPMIQARSPLRTPPSGRRYSQTPPIQSPKGSCGVICPSSKKKVPPTVILAPRELIDDQSVMSDYSYDTISVDMEFSLPDINDGYRSTPPRARSPARAITAASRSGLFEGSRQSGIRSPQISYAPPRQISPQYQLAYNQPRVSPQQARYRLSNTILPDRSLRTRSPSDATSIGPPSAESTKLPSPLKIVKQLLKSFSPKRTSKVNCGTSNIPCSIATVPSIPRMKSPFQSQARISPRSSPDIRPPLPYNIPYSPLRTSYTPTQPYIPRRAVTPTQLSYISNPSKSSVKSPTRRSPFRAARTPPQDNDGFVSVLDTSLVDKSISDYPKPKSPLFCPINLDISIKVPKRIQDADISVVKKLVDEENEDAVVSKLIMTPLKEKLQKMNGKPQAVKLLEETLNQSIPGDDTEDRMKSDIVAAMLNFEEKGHLSPNKSPKHTYEALFPPTTDEQIIIISPAAPSPFQNIVVPNGEADLSNFIMNDQLVENEMEAVEIPNADAFAKEINQNEEFKKKKIRFAEETKERTEKIARESKQSADGYIPRSGLEEEIAPWDINIESLEELIGGEMSFNAEDVPSDESIRTSKNRLEYILEHEKPLHYSCVQLRGSQPPEWFPGYYNVFPHNPNLIQLENSVSKTMQIAWNVFAPQEILDNSEVFII